MKILHMIDLLAWGMVRVIGLMQALIGELILIFYQPNPCKTKEYDDFNILMSMTFGGWMLFHSHKPEDLPSFMSERILNVGRFILGVIVICTITDAIKAVV